MKKILCVVGVLIAVNLLLIGNVSQAKHGEEKPAKKAILVVAFGTSVPQAQVAYEQVDKRIKEIFPATEICWAYTSKAIRHKLAKQGTVLESPETAMAKLMDDDFTHVAVLPLHAIPGLEFHETYANLRAFQTMLGGIKELQVARPLLASQEDCRKVAQALIKRVPESRKPDDAVIFMGHGTPNHPSYAGYYAMNAACQALDRNVHIACVAGEPCLEDVILKIKAQGVKRAYLMPMMAVAGEHAHKDMAGDQKDSWKSVLASEGIQCEAVLKGIAEYPEVVQVWLDHLKGAYERLK
ncbi:MAG: sirohydrochlorin cobaltochelatase [Desulfomonile tiedjei]|nr:sirohydrochlorin cobaltochelatase [Desulfomonile tiedjei]